MFWKTYIGFYNDNFYSHDSPPFNTDIYGKYGTCFVEGEQERRYHGLLLTTSTLIQDYYLYE